jgi:hypothetical protein
MTSGKFDSWSTEALRGYVVMIEQILSIQHEENTHDMYVERLTSVKTTLEIREREELGKKTSISFRENIVTTPEENAKVDDENKNEIVVNGDA